MASARAAKPLPPPLSHDQVQLIQGILTEHGGNVSGGLLTSLVPGVKKVQLMAHFEVHHAGEESNFHVALPGAQLDQAIVSKSSAKRKAGGADHDETDQATDGRKKKKRRNHLDADPPPLEESQIQMITEALIERGGRMSGGVLTSLFPGLRKIQVEAAFDVQTGDKGEFIVTVPPQVQHDDQKGFLDDTILQQITEQLKENGGSMPGSMIADTFPGLEKEQLEAAGFHISMLDDDDFLVSSFTHGRYSQAATVPLDRLRVQEISNALRERGGSINGGTLASMFPGVKKAQLEANFHIIPTDKEFIVCLSPNAAQGPSQTMFTDPKGSGHWVFVPSNISRPDLIQQNSSRAAKGQSGAGVATSSQNAVTTANARKKKRRETNSALMIPLSSDTVQAVQEFLESQGGKSSGGLIASKFPGLKRKQLEECFSVTTEPGGEYAVAVMS
eukprot:TRINITY_DN14970_c0_g2_i1.p1 TRINITY_DN14970_c0_g2~~TRINITY_DN14970_c0_g2_i1.p1  ORF type:complete len:465 (+),score=56.50 TRINITY_DN14970_c0_g2_i1:63-1397(+)